MADRKQSDFGNIQREAMNRARQMQQNDRQEKERVEKNDQKIESKSNVKIQNNFQQGKNIDNIKHTDLMDIIMADKERSLIILLIILLTEEKADSSLILALMYLII